MSQTFNERFYTEIEQMKAYLLMEKLRMIQFSFTDGWKFKLSISQREYKKLKRDQSC